MRLDKAVHQKSIEQIELPLEGRGEASGARRSDETVSAAQGAGRSGLDALTLMERVVERGNPQYALLGDAVTYSYNSETGDLEQVISPSSILGTYTYANDVSGRPSALVKQDGTSESYLYGTDSRRYERVEFKPDLTRVHDDSLLFDARGKALQAKTKTFGAPNTDVFSYAGLGSVLGATGPQSESYARDPLGNTHTRDVATANWSGSFTNTYQQYSTRLSGFVGAPSAFATDSVTVAYDEVGRVSLRTEHLHAPATCPGQITCSPAQPDVFAWSTLSNGYSGDGQLLTSELRTSNDGFAQIDTTAVAPFGAMGRGVFEEYRYDALGRRVWVHSHRKAYCEGLDSDPICLAAVERFVYDGDQVLYEIRQAGDSASTTAEDDVATDATHQEQFGVVAYLHGAATDQPLGLVRSYPYGATAPLVLHRDWQGNIDFGTSPTGAVVDCSRNGNLAGCQITSWPGLDQSIGFQRPMSDIGVANWMGTLSNGNLNATGTVDMRARQFDPKTGQFLQEDPMGMGGGINTYGFGNGDAVNNRDPSGMECYRNESFVNIWNGAVLESHITLSVTYFGDCAPQAPNGGGGNGSTPRDPNGVTDRGIPKANSPRVQAALQRCYEGLAQERRADYAAISGLAGFAVRTPAAGVLGLFVTPKTTGGIGLAAALAKGAATRSAPTATLFGEVVSGVGVARVAAFGLVQGLLVKTAWEMGVKVGLDMSAHSCVDPSAY